MQITSPAFKENARQALADPQLQKAMLHVRSGFIDKRQHGVDALPEFEELRESARAIKDHTLAHLDIYLEAYEEKVKAAGGHVHRSEERRVGKEGRSRGAGEREETQRSRSADDRDIK